MILEKHKWHLMLGATMWTFPKDLHRGLLFPVLKYDMLVMRDGRCEFAQHGGVVPSIHALPLWSKDPEQRHAAREKLERDHMEKLMLGEVTW